VSHHSLRSSGPESNYIPDKLDMESKSLKSPVKIAIGYELSAFGYQLSAL
jgi:hypothetical protein